MILRRIERILSHNLGNQASSFWVDPVVQYPFGTVCQSIKRLFLVVFVFLRGVLRRRPQTLQSARNLVDVIGLET